MPRYIAFLRAINVGGHTVKMDLLRRHFEALGLDQVETFIASGNVIFASSARNTQSLEEKIAGHLEKKLGYDVATFIRTEADLARVAGHEPWSKTMIERAAAFNIAFLDRTLDQAAQRKLQTLKTAIDDFATHEREVYWLCKTRQGKSTFSNAVLEKTLGVRSTLRGVNTVRQLAEKYAPAR
jgi:uncharacterized protein (DUF1697 family)